MKIAVASGKGGTGKTTVSTNLASMMAARMPILLADLDVEEPNSGLFVARKEADLEQTKYRMVPRWDSSACTRCGMCQDVCNFHAIIALGKQVMVFPELCHGCYACSGLCPADALPMVQEPMGVTRVYEAGALTFIESRLDIGQEQAVPLIAQTKGMLEERYADAPLTILDSPPGTSCPVIEAVKDVDLVLLVTEPTPFGLNDLILAVETVRELGKPFAVIINRYGIGNDDVLDYCRDEQIELIAMIPNSREAAGKYSSGKLIYESIPEISREFRKIERFILGRMHAQEAGR